MKALIHVDQTRNLQLALNNSKNLLAQAEETGVVIELELVFNGPAIVNLVAGENSGGENAGDESAEFEAEIKSLIKRGVKVFGCQNSLSSNGISAEDLIEGVETVPAAILELIEKQHQGYAYVKP